jgi:hypothetical protein
MSNAKTPTSGGAFHSLFGLCSSVVATPSTALERKQVERMMPFRNRPERSSSRRRDYVNQRLVSLQ